VGARLRLDTPCSPARHGDCVHRALGAAWEIFEFASDSLIGTHTQGAPDMGPLADTKWDLIVDGSAGRSPRPSVVSGCTILDAAGDA
jgi:hypothetical protein